MTKKQRFLAALRLEEPDVVPVCPLIHCRYAHTLLGRSDWAAVQEVHQRLGSVNFRGPQGVGCEVRLGPGYGANGESWDDEQGRHWHRHTLITPRGELTELHVSGMIPHDPLTGRTVEYLVKEPEDWWTYEAFWQEWARNATPDPTGIARIWETFGEDGIASVGQGSVYHTMAGARGMEGMLLDLYDCPDLILGVSETMWEVVRLHLEGWLQSPAEVLWYDVCWATGAVMGPDLFERFALPDLAKAVEVARSVPGKYLGFYTLGRMKHILPMIADTEPHFIETFEPNEGDVTLAEAKRRYGDGICIMGNYDCVTLAMGTVEQAREETRRCLREGMEGGGYVLVTGDEVPADAKWDNLRAMVEVVEAEGVYG